MDISLTGGDVLVILGIIVLILVAASFLRR